MIRYNTITISPVSHLEVGDVIALSFLHGVVSGKITAISYFRYQLTEEQIKYMEEHNLSVPKNKYESLGGDGSLLVFGDFKDTTDHVSETDHHMYLDIHTNVAVFSR